MHKTRQIPKDNSSEYRRVSTRTKIKDPIDLRKEHWDRLLFKDSREEHPSFTQGIKHPSSLGRHNQYRAVFVNSFRERHIVTVKKRTPCLSLVFDHLDCPFPGILFPIPGILSRGTGRKEWRRRGGVVYRNPLSRHSDGDDWEGYMVYFSDPVIAFLHYTCKWWVVKQVARRKYLTGFVPSLFRPKTFLECSQSRSCTPVVSLTLLPDRLGTTKSC